MAKPMGQRGVPSGKRANGVLLYWLSGTAAIPPCQRALAKYHKRSSEAVRSLCENEEHLLIACIFPS